uniref:Uncharacterized protein n=1 Tax=Anguilla anguilla TaxID=7936 RepID=A0A0E9S2I5_ANGAN
MQKAIFKRRQHQDVFYHFFCQTILFQKC